MPSLRPVEPTDIPVLFKQQLDPEANLLAGTKPRTAEVFASLWQKIFGDPTVVARVIVDDGRVVGSISCFKHEGLESVGYWIAKEHWGKGFATRALGLFLSEVPRRPLHANVQRGNAASIRVLQKCGFQPAGSFMGEETDRYLPGEVASFRLD